MSKREKAERMLTVPKHLLSVNQIIFGPMLQDKNYPHFTVEQTEAQRGALTCPDVTQLGVRFGTCACWSAKTMFLPTCLSSALTKFTWGFRGFMDSWS